MWLYTQHVSCGYFIIMPVRFAFSFQWVPFPFSGCLFLSAGVKWVASQGGILTAPSSAGCVINSNITHSILSCHDVFKPIRIFASLPPGKKVGKLEHHTQPDCSLGIFKTKIGHSLSTACPSAVCDSLLTVLCCGSCSNHG